MIEVKAFFLQIELDKKTLLVKISNKIKHIPTAFVHYIRLYEMDYARKAKN